MTTYRIASVAILAALVFAAAVPPAAAAPRHSGARAQGAPPSEASAQRRRRPERPRIQINRGHLLYRRCEGGYELQHRPSGTVLFPYKHCWWVRG